MELIEVDNILVQTPEAGAQRTNGAISYSTTRQTVKKILVCINPAYCEIHIHPEEGAPFIKIYVGMPFTFIKPVV